MRERVGELVGRSVRAMWVTTFHSSCARMLRADAERLGYSRSFTIYDQSDSLRMLKRCLRELGVDPKRYPPRAIQLEDLRRQEPADRLRHVRGNAGQRLRGGRRRSLPALREADARGQRDGLRRPPGPHGQRPGAVRGGPRALAPHLPPRPRRRVPGHQPRPVPAAAAARRRARQPDGGRRRGPVDLRLPPRRHPQHPRLRAATSPRPRWSSSSRTTARPRRSSPPPTRWSSATASGGRRSSGPRSRAASWSSSPSSATSTRRRAGWRRRSSGSARSTGSRRSDVAVFYRTNAMSRVLEDTLVRFEVPYQVIGGTKFYDRAEVKDAVAYLSLLLNPADQVSFSRDRQLAAARDRQHHPGPARLLRQHRRADDLGGDRTGRGGAGAERRRDQGRLPLLRDDGDLLRARVDAGASVADVLQAVLSETGYLEALEAERTVEAEGPGREPRSADRRPPPSSTSTASARARARCRRWRSSCSRSRCSATRTRSRTSRSW